VKFRKEGPKFLEDMHFIFGKSHVSGASAEIYPPMSVSAIKPYEGFGDVDHTIKELMSL
jgi:hypothetical protein